MFSIPNSAFRVPRLHWLVAVLLLSAMATQGAVVINELSAAASDRQLSWSTNGAPRLGSGIGWMEPGFNSMGWSSGLLPAGYGFNGLSTDLTSTMKDKAPSLYLRKEFVVSAVQAALTDPLRLFVEFNDGFVAYVNGREVARVNCGGTNRFMFASQPAFNVNTNTGLIEHVLGPANALLVPGTNVLAIQAHNAEEPSTAADPSRITQHIPTPEFQISAALRTTASSLPGAPIVSLDFNDGAGGSRTYASTNGVIIETSSGTFAPNGWLATAPAPASAATWQGLEIVSTESAGSGIGGSGALRYTIRQSGPSQPAALRAPAVNMSGEWLAGSVSAANLSGATLRVRYRTTGNAQFALRFDPAAGQEASAISGFPVLAGGSQPPVTFSNASGGTRTMTVNSTGGQSQAVSGSLSSLSMLTFASADVRSMTFRIVEDATVGAGYNGSKGHVRGEITQAAAAGTSWGFTYGGITVSNWSPGSVTVQDLTYAGFRFACKIPAGVVFQIWAEPGAGGFSNRVEWGTITGDGTWRLIEREFADAPGSENFRAALNAANTRNFRLVLQGSASLATGTWIQIDDLQVVPWHRFEARLSDGVNGQPAFLSWLNANSSVSFIPTFSKLTDAPAGGQTLTIDNYEVLYVGTNAASITNLVLAGSAGGPWSYRVGIAEPAGGVYDEGLLTNTFVPPAGEEDDYEEPDTFVDWIELHNNGASALNLSGWSLTDERDTPAKWRFPTNTTIPPGGHLLVLCDDREEANAPAGPATMLHTSFSLSGDGEYLALFDATGVLVDGITSGYPKQVFFASYGRGPTNAAQFGFLTTATPGAPNIGAHYQARVDAPEFRRTDGTNELPGGLYTAASLTLLLTNKTPGATIRYTLNGSEPTEANGINYTAPLLITQPGDRTGAVVRARAFLPGWLPSGVKTYTYLLRQPPAITNVPAILFTGQKERAFYKPLGLLAIQGGVYQPATDGGEMWNANGPQSYNEPLGNGLAFEREVHMEYYFPQSYYPSNRQPFREDVGLRVSSSPYQRARLTFANVEANSPWQPAWNVNEKPSFNIFFRGDYGPSKLDYPVFREYRVREFQHLRLRAGKNDSANPFITDELVRRLWIDMEHVGARGLFCSLYLNGVYKGIYNLTERIREPMFQEHYQSSLDWDVRYNYDWVNGDGTAYSAMMSALNANLTTIANWQAAEQRINVDNFADYYLLNIYCAMWDWPENNFVFARERSTGPLGRFTYAVWDAEGAFNVNAYYNKGVEFNTITADLETKQADVCTVWRRLVTSPEFKLRFADRINRHLFNGGILDDRDPDGSGTLKSRFQQRLDELVTEAGPLVQYNHGAPIYTNLFMSWTAPTNGRRSYLLGNTAGRQIFRDAGLWPTTEPPIFNQHGGAVSPGFALGMTSAVAVAGQTATIFYRVDGADPRLQGGALRPGSLTYTGAVTLTNIVTVLARARNDMTGEWSALTEATFAPSAVPATSNNLVVAELMYHPPDATAAELAAGISNADDFEFVRLQNISASPVDLRAVRFTTGVLFDFATAWVRYVNPGENVLLVKSRPAFRLRYGTSLDARIAGEFANNLSNGGERLQVLGGPGTILRDFTYLDGGAWPESPDGDGPSLLLRDPFSNPNHAEPTNWVASAIPGGLPGGVAPLFTYEEWRALLWSPAAATNDSVSGRTADADQDGLANYVEYVLGLHPTRGQPTKRPQVKIESIAGVDYMTVQYTRSASVPGPIVTVQVSSNLVDWVSGPPHTEFLWSLPNIDGTTSFKYRDVAPVSTTPTHFLRLRIAE